MLFSAQIIPHYIRGANFCWALRLKQARMHSVSNARSPSHLRLSVEKTGGMTMQVTQAHASEDSIPTGEEGESVPVKAFSLDAYSEQ